MSRKETEKLDQEMLQIQVNIDDMNPEMYSYVLEQLFTAGARDAFLTPIIMKKGRPGMQLSVLVENSKLNEIEELIFKETSSIGLRYATITCHRLERDMNAVETPWGKVDVKIGYLNGVIVNVAPEYEDCANAARKGNVPLKKVFEWVRGQIPLTPNPMETTK